MDSAPGIHLRQVNSSFCTSCTLTLKLRKTDGPLILTTRYVAMQLKDSFRDVQLPGGGLAALGAGTPEIREPGRLRTWDILSRHMFSIFVGQKPLSKRSLPGSALVGNA